MDLIYRETAVNALKLRRRIAEMSGCTDFVDGMDYSIKVITDEDLVPHLRHHSRWAESGDGWECEKCRSRNARKSTYCPDCGAWMENTA